ncbi:MAG: hypothetical protein LBN21_12100 [Treponema sp.]|jgi:predicted RNA-binding Zn-ribbon protein involved in translation (DUF1610 family)|nr:hypothetical protein [Treponema sp.]
MLRDRLERFMHGRYGQDELNRVLSVTALALCVISLIIQLPVLSSLAIALVIICVFRSFSRNTGKRVREAESYFALKSRIFRFFTGIIERLRVSRTHRIFACPSCGQRCRVPKGLGSVRITCKKCGAKFMKKT